MPRCALKISSYLILALLAVGCGSTSRLNNGLISRLNNRGPVALSTDNPFLAANLLVSREMQKSEEVKGFVEHSGAPSAIEVRRSTFSPLVINFYYVERGEFYTFEELLDGWLISGPFQLSAESISKITHMISSNAGEPKLAVLSSPIEHDSHPVPVLDQIEPTETQNGTQPQVSTKELQAQKNIKQIVKDTPHLEGEITPKGDLVHYVTMPGETLSILARWYTGDRDNAGRLARINKLTDPNTLSIGDSLLVPSYLLNNKNRLTPEALTSLQKVAQSEK